MASPVAPRFLQAALKALGSLTPAAGFVPYYTSTSAAALLRLGHPSLDSNFLDVTQSSHGFAFGDALRHNGTSWVKALADAEANADAVGLVCRVPDTNTFTVQFGGWITGFSGLTAGTCYFLSRTTAGALVTTKTTTAGQVNKPLLFSYSTVAGVVQPLLGTVVPS